MNKIDRALAWALGLLQLMAGASGAAWVSMQLQFHLMMMAAGENPVDWGPLFPGLPWVLGVGVLSLVATAAGVCLFLVPRHGARLALLAMLPQAFGFLTAALLYSLTLGPDWGVELAFDCETALCTLEQTTYRPPGWTTMLQVDTDRSPIWLGVSVNFAVLLQGMLACWILWKTRRQGKPR